MGPFYLFLYDPSPSFPVIPLSPSLWLPYPLLIFPITQNIVYLQVAFPTSQYKRKTPLENMKDAKSSCWHPLEYDWTSLNMHKKELALLENNLSHCSCFLSSLQCVRYHLFFLFMCQGSLEFRGSSSSSFTARDAFGHILRFPSFQAYY